MTRENKLALVVGFGLILVVAILISDHFSAARSQRQADLMPVSDPLIEARNSNPELIDFGPGPAGTPARGAETSAPARLALNAGRLETRRPGAGQQAQIAMPDLQAPPAAVHLAPEQARDLPYTFHVVAPGESLTSICRRQYHDETMAAELARYNDLEDPDQIQAGMRLRLPPADALARGAAAPAGPSRPPPTDSVPPATTTRTYTIESGDVLSVLSQRLLGTSKRWRELYEFNRDVIDDPDHLRVGKVIRIPPSGHR